jgi:outer membrane protein assembly factor BamD
VSMLTMSRRLAPLLLGVWLAGCGASVLPAVHSETERLSLARRLRDQGKYEQSIELLKTYVDNNAGAADVDDAIYMLGDSYLKTKAWAEAGTEFERLLRDYPESDSSGSARFRLAEALFAQSRPVDFDQDFTLRAIDEYQRYLHDFPGHWLNAEAERRLLAARTRLADKLVRTGSLYLKLRLADPARAYFTRVTSEYSDTSKVAEAELGLALADAMQGKRTEAVAQLKTIEERYPGQPVAERAARERKRLEKRS